MQKKYILLLSLSGVFVTAVLSLTNGITPISFSTLRDALFYHMGQVNIQAVVWDIRLPRLCVNYLVGINLALSGAILQAILHNPLADPHIIGISAGAGFAGLVIIMVLPQYQFLFMPVAFLGAMLAAFTIYLLAWKNGIRPLRIILAGVAVSTLLGAGISALLILYSERLQGALLWLMGGFSLSSWTQVKMILPYSCLGIASIFWLGKYLNILQLGDEMALSLGLSVERARFFLTSLAAILATSAVAVAGLLGFVGLIVPHLARLCIGNDYRYLLPLAVLLGASLVSLSDTLARCLFAPLELPAGIFLALFGVPFFLYLLRKNID